MANSEGASADQNRSMDGINSVQSTIEQSVDGSEVTGRLPATVANVGRQRSSVVSHHWLRSRANDSFMSGADEEIVDRMPPEIPFRDGSDARRPRFYQIDSEVSLVTDTSGDDRQSQSSVSVIESETVLRQQQASQPGKSPSRLLEPTAQI